MASNPDILWDFLPTEIQKKIWGYKLLSEHQELEWATARTNRQALHEELVAFHSWYHGFSPNQNITRAANRVSQFRYIIKTYTEIEDISYEQAMNILVGYLKFYVSYTLEIKIFISLRFGSKVSVRIALQVNEWKQYHHILMKWSLVTIGSSNNRKQY